MKPLRLLTLAAAVLVGLAITAWFVHRNEIPSASGAFQSAGAGSWQTVALTAAYGFAVTLVGVALGATYRRLVRLRASGVDAISPGKLIAAVVSSVDFQIGLVGAPVVYGLLWQSISDIHIAGLTIIALQNGFTSHAILDQLMGNKPQQPAAAG
jgi:hypothetical protein